MTDRQMMIEIITTTIRNSYNNNFDWNTAKEIAEGLHDYENFLHEFEELINEHAENYFQMFILKDDAE